MLKKILKNQNNALYLSEEHSSNEVSSYVFTCPQSQAICNDPLVLGLDYTEKLHQACAESLKLIQEAEIINFQEDLIAVLNILRGGLNFELRRALNTAFDFNSHSSVFLSAQRKLTDSGNWIITEDSYQKLNLKDQNQIIFGDVVATGTSLEYGLTRLFDYSLKNNHNIKDVIFFTIGGPRSTEILNNLYQRYQDQLKIEKMIVVYLEGIFTVAEESTPYSIKLPGTDLINYQSLLAPEFVESKSGNPSFWLERCAIYDAGSRAFNIPEYLEDVIEYWEEIAVLASKMSFEDLFKERNPDFIATDTNKLSGLADFRLTLLKKKLII